jgi:large subunit ribosomal protein L29
MAKTESYASLSVTELTAKIAEEKLNYKKTKFTHAISSSENPLKIRADRRAIARMLTELSKKEKSK